MGLLIDPEDRTVFIYHPNGTMEIFDEPEAQLLVPEFARCSYREVSPTIELTVGDIFRWLGM
jgi:Uma2 family endonuclease